MQKGYVIIFFTFFMWSSRSYIRCNLQSWTNLPKPEGHMWGIRPFSLISNVIRGCWFKSRRSYAPHMTFWLYMHHAYDLLAINDSWSNGVRPYVFDDISKSYRATAFIFWHEMRAVETRRMVQKSGIRPYDPYTTFLFWGIDIYSKGVMKKGK